MSTRVEILGEVVDALKHTLWVEPAYEIIRLAFEETYESLDDFLWDVSIEATSLLLPNLDLGPTTQYTQYQLDTLVRLVANKITIKATHCLALHSMYYNK